MFSPTFTIQDTLLLGVREGEVLDQLDQPRRTGTPGSKPGTPWSNGPSQPRAIVDACTTRIWRRSPSKSPATWRRSPSIGPTRSTRSTTTMAARDRRGRGRRCATPTTSTPSCCRPTASGPSHRRRHQERRHGGSCHRTSGTAFDPGVTSSPKFHHKVWKPVVAAVHGMCAGGGQYFINEADIVICSDDAAFFDPHANGGIVSALEPIGMLARGVPLGDVLRLGADGHRGADHRRDRAAARPRQRGGASRRAARRAPGHRRPDRGTQPTARSRARSGRSGSRST